MLFIYLCIFFSLTYFLRSMMVDHRQYKKFFRRCWEKEDEKGRLNIDPIKEADRDLRIYFIQIILVTLAQFSHAIFMRDNVNIPDIAFIVISAILVFVVYDLAQIELSIRHRYYQLYRLILTDGYSEDEEVRKKQSLEIADKLARIRLKTKPYANAIIGKMVSIYVIIYIFG